MFSGKIQNLLNTSGLDSAKSRAIQLESNVFKKTQSLENTSTHDRINFQEILKKQESQPLDFKLAPAPPVSKGYIQDKVKKAALKYGVDEKLIMAIIKQESNFKADAVSKAGAEGLMQLMPKTAQHLGVKNSFDPDQNINGGVKYLKSLLNKYNGNMILALAAYNAGPGNVAKYDGVPPYKETQNYVKKILANYLS